MQAVRALLYFWWFCNNRDTHIIQGYFIGTEAILRFLSVILKIYLDKLDIPSNL